MKKSELETIITNIGLESETNNNINTILQVWQPYKNGGFKFNDHYYSAEVLGEKEVKSLNSKFEKLRRVLIKEKIIIRSSYIIENGVVASWVLEIKNGKTKQLSSDFEIETEISKLNFGKKDYDDVIPTIVGYDYVSTPLGVKKEFFKHKLKKHEKEMVINNMSELLKTLFPEENISWMHNFLIYQNSIEPFKKAIENNLIDPADIINSVLSNIDAYASHSRYKQLFSILSKIKIDRCTLYKKRGTTHEYLPSFIVESPTMFNNILKNWDFSVDTGQHIISFLIKNEYIKQFKQFIKIKNPNKYKFVDWNNTIEYVLKTVCNDDPKYLKMLLTKGWMSLDEVYYGYFIEFLVDVVNELNFDTYIIVLQEFLKNHNHHDELLEQLFDRFEIDDLHDSFISRGIMGEFIKFTNLSLVSDFKIKDASILIYLDDNHPLRKKLLSDQSFISYLLEINKTEYLPQETIDMFMF